MWIPGAAGNQHIVTHYISGAKKRASLHPHQAAIFKHTTRLERDNEAKPLYLRDRRMQVIPGWLGFIPVASVLHSAVSVPSTWSNCWSPSLLHTTNLGPRPGTTVASSALRAPATGSLQREMELFRIVTDDNSNYWSSSFVSIFPDPQLPRGLSANFSHHRQIDGYIYHPFFVLFRMIAGVCSLC